MASSVRIGIISIGEMGLGIARLLAAHKIQVSTCLVNRSAATKRRAKSADITDFEDYETFVDNSDVILSIVPPRDAIGTAELISSTANASLRPEASSRGRSLHFMDLNAVSPQTAAKLVDIMKPRREDCARDVIFVDGGIIGPPPKQPQDDAKSWTKPSIVLSGPHALDSPTAPAWGKQLMSILNMKHISADIGRASGLKMCFASLTKGFTSIAIQSYTTAHRLGVLPELQSHLDMYFSSLRATAERSLVGMPPKAYRWVNEMEEISKTFDTDGGFEQRMFDAVAGVYQSVADETVLGEERTDERKRGLTPLVSWNSAPRCESSSIPSPKTKASLDFVLMSLRTLQRQ